MDDAPIESVEIRGVRLPLDPALLPPHILGVLRQGQYEEGEVGALARVLRPGDRVLDLGSGLGLTSTFAAIQPGIEAVTSFEANPGLLPHLARVYEMNGAKVDLRHGVLVAGEGGGTATFYIRDMVWNSTLHPKRTAPHKAVEVPTVSLAAVLAELRPTVLSCDIEGAEIELLGGSDLPGIREIVIELHPKARGKEATDALLAHLAGLGFRRHGWSRGGGVRAFHREGAGGRLLRQATGFLRRRG